MKITIDIPEKELLFIQVPEIYKNFKIMNYGYAGTYLIETDTDGLNHWKKKLPNGIYDIIGFTKDVFREECEPSDTNFILRKVYNG